MQPAVWLSSRRSGGIQHRSLGDFGEGARAQAAAATAVDQTRTRLEVQAACQQRRHIPAHHRVARDSSAQAGAVVIGFGG